ncbi:MULTISPECIES: hypothetical protein [unclassified Thioalkalivibrio]|uniref:hypothetical protein n=1 Tax=unclassified Thioalkalivibrio TaxID=2621013 RepID=UPI000361ADAD|nr:MULTISPECIES: hypothetical protein [unclassified Thioalkalivibrio]
MKIYVLLAQRKESYEGEYGPEALGAMTEYEYDINPEFLEERRNEYSRNREFSAVRIVALDIPEGEVERRLMPEATPIQARVASEE